MHQIHPFDEAIQLEPQGDGHWRGHTHEAYGNMGAFDVEATAARTNRSTQHWSVQMRQGADVVATATAVLATRRETWSAVEAGFPEAPPAEAIARTQPLDHVRWTSAYDMRFVQGPLQIATPPAGEQDSVSLLWVRDEPPRALDFCSLAALCDVFFPRIFVKRATWVPIGTVSFTVYFHADAVTLAAIGTRHLLAHARAHQFRNGYFDQSAELQNLSRWFAEVTSRPTARA